MATSPTRTSPFFAKATTDGVVREPSAFAITVGSPPSSTLTTEFVVPRSMPTARAMSVCLSIHAGAADRACEPTSWGWNLSVDRLAEGHPESSVRLKLGRLDGLSLPDSGWRPPGLRRRDESVSLNFLAGDGIPLVAGMPVLRAEAPRRPSGPRDRPNWPGPTRPRTQARQAHGGDGVRTPARS
ncbi:hypothetical protein FRACA_420020 [Frankia canadensis]|uniref:Uncharacterized protein n=1 Tax=Frankia canadensis TaxID=1836972 RepID=A0A2I2KX31_9ACTN|nr:hypothetical protein FRACA_420020 [Frankia canadensis]SOU57509.1 hypothetical protein FRACA_420020 [Frankia canadensis]